MSRDFSLIFLLLSYFSFSLNFMNSTKNPPYFLFFFEKKTTIDFSSKIHKVLKRCFLDISFLEFVVYVLVNLWFSLPHYVSSHSRINSNWVLRHRLLGFILLLLFGFLLSFLFHPSWNVKDDLRSFLILVYLFIFEK